MLQFEVFLPEPGCVNDPKLDLRIIFAAWQEKLQREHIIGDSPAYLFQTGDDALKHQLLDTCEEPLRLVGSLHYGTCVEDEWFVTRLLFDFSRDHPQLYIRATDREDGEFLLIEAAEHLPDWVIPELMDGRTFIHQGRIEWLEPPSTPSEIAPPPLPRSQPRTPSLPPGIPWPTAELPSFLGRLKPALEAVQTTIQARLEKVPLAVRIQRHRTICKLPSHIARLLKRRPSCIGAAIDALQTRLSEPGRSSLSNLSMEMTKSVEAKWSSTSVLMTRSLFALLSSFDRFQWPLSLVKVLSDGVDDQDRQRLELGIKIVCGFELLLSADPSSSSSSSTSSPPSSSPLCPPEYVSSSSSFIVSLHNQLREEEQLIQNTEEEEELHEDPDDWMSVLPEEVDDLLARYAPDRNLPADDSTSSQIFEDLSAFLHHKSDIQAGAEAAPQELQPIKLNADKFLAILREDPSMSAMLEELDDELRGKACGLEEFDQDRVVEHLFNSIVAQRGTTAGASPAESLLRFARK